MPKRFVSIWFRSLQTDWVSLRRPALREMPFVLAAADHGRMVITAANAIARSQGIDIGMVVADARAIISSLQVLDDNAVRSEKLLKAIAEWCIRFTPVVALDPPDGIILDATGCAHLWGGEKFYLENIVNRLKKNGYHVNASMAGTVGTAWAMARYGDHFSIIEDQAQSIAILSLPPAALRIDIEIIERLEKLGLRQIRDFISMPRPALRRRFGPELLKKLDFALGNEEEIVHSIQPVEPYQERLPCLEPIVTATGIEIALQRLLDMLCKRLQQEENGLRVALLKCFRVDGKIEMVEIGTHRATHNAKHLFKLFGIKLGNIEPALGIELFTLEAKKVEELSPLQEKLWERSSGLENTALNELLDRISGKFGQGHVHRYLPDEHYWPERSIKSASSLNEKLTGNWRAERPRPLQLLSRPQPIDVTAPIPDYPPMTFRYKQKLHKIIRSEGPERIEQEWWLQQGQHRDYYYVEDEEGRRYWLFRLGHYSDERYQWFIHGFFA
jgi:protein ImuB